MTNLAALVLERFVERRDVLAVQKSDGTYAPRRRPLTIAEVEAHLEGDRTIGHYLVSPEGTARIVAYDIDLSARGYWYSLSEDGPDGPQECNPRQVWASGTHPGIPYLTHQLRSVASALAERLGRLAEIPVAVTYSGAKGLHVYGFYGSAAATDLRDLALGVLGTFRDPQGDPWFVRSGPSYASTRTPNYTIEVFPKQATIAADGYGSLMRLPLGRHRRSRTDGFVVDQSAPLTVLRPADPLQVLAEGDGW